MQSRIGFFALLALILGSAPALAASARLSYQAPEGCPGQAAFVAAVQARGASLAVSESSEARSLTVAIQREEGGFLGRLQLSEGAQASEPRQVRGASCEEVGDALAVVTAIALQSDAAQPSVAVRAVAAAPQPTLPAQPVPAQPLRERAVHTVLWNDEVPVSAGQLKLGYVQGYTLTGGAALGVIPNLTLPRFDLTLSRSNLISTPGADDYLLGGILRVRWSFFAPSTRFSPGYATRLWGTKAGIGARTPFVYHPRGLVLKACSEIAAGAMALETKDATGARTQSKTVGIGTASFELGTEYNLGSFVHLALALGGEMWLSKVTAENAEGDQLFHSKVFNGYASAGLGVHF